MTAPDRGTKLLRYVAEGRRVGKNSNDLPAVYVDLWNCQESSCQAQIYTGTPSRPGSSPREGL